MTKVLGQQLARTLLVAVLLIATGVSVAQAKPANEPEQGPAARLYQQLGAAGLDCARVRHVRDASIERPGAHLTLEDGTIAFTQDVMGKITGAFFEGDGELLVAPPNEAERQSMSLFTGMAILEERFSTAYFRFNDSTATELSPGLRAADDSEEFCERWKGAAASLAQADALRLLLTFSRDLTAPNLGALTSTADPADRFLRARLQGVKLGIFDVVYDAAASEALEVGQARKSSDGTLFYDVWTSFSPVSPGKKQDTASDTATPGPIDVTRISLQTHVKPPTQIEAEATLELQTRRSGDRALLFELSRFIRVNTVERDGRAVEFIHNPSVEGTQLARHGNDVIAVILDRPSVAGQTLSLRFTYQGEVLADAGPGLLYVGARGNWYPNRVPEMADYDLEFYYPPGWTLVATGKPVPVATAANEPKSTEQVSRWISDRQIPVAGFNLGKYKRATARAGNVAVESYGAAVVERNFPTPHPEMADPVTLAPGQSPIDPLPVRAPSPAGNAQLVADAAASAIRYYADRFGPFPYSQLALTQLPGPESQGWPGLIFLSSFAFLTDAERDVLHRNDMSKILERQIPAHETAHQWWGDLVTWRTYRDQWISEALANYSSLMELEDKNPAAFHRALDYYRQQLLRKTDSGRTVGSAGPVTMGGRLASSQSPDAYEPVVYGRGTWLIHMLRMMLRDATAKRTARDARARDELFIKALLNFRNRFEGRAASTQDLLSSFEADLPTALKFEGRSSLDWFEHSWVEGSAIPHISIHSVKLVPKGNMIEAAGVIQQKESPADLVTLVPVYAVVGNSRVLLGQVFADGDETAFHFPAPSGTTRLLLDPERTILDDVR